MLRKSSIIAVTVYAVGASLLLVLMPSEHFGLDVAGAVLCGLLLLGKCLQDDRRRRRLGLDDGR